MRYDEWASVSEILKTAKRIKFACSDVPLTKFPVVFQVFFHATAELNLQIAVIEFVKLPEKFMQGFMKNY